MVTRENYNELYPLVAFNTQLINSDTTTNGVIIDTAHYELGILFVMQTATITTGAFTPLLEESDDSGFSTSNEIADVNIVPVNVGGTWYETGQEAALAFVAADDNAVRTVGVVGTKRYVRLSFVTTGTADGTVGATVLKKGECQSVYGL